MSEAAFIPGLDLSKTFYLDIIRPLLAAEFPTLQYSCGLIGAGSEVLGFDDAMSRDHHWGPRAMVFLHGEDYARIRSQLHEYLASSLPPTFHGYPTNFSLPDPEDNGTQLLQLRESGPINHRIEIHTIRGYLLEYLGFDILEQMHASHWLALPQQKLLTITRGRMFHDDLGLDAVRAKFSYYPQDVWLYLLAATWKRIEEEGHLMGRAGYVGDEVGSALIASRLVRDIMRLCFLLEKHYIPYPKWFGTAFSQLNSGPELMPLLKAVLTAADWENRQEHLCAAYEQLARIFNASTIIDPIPTSAEQFFNRPFKVISKGQVSKAIEEKITDPEVKTLLDKPLIGSVDLFSDSTDLLSSSDRFLSLVHLYET